MTYSGELVMPTSYVEVAEEEMTYLDGGATIISKSTCRNTLAAIGMSPSTYLVAALAAGVATKLIRKVSAALGGIAGWIVGTILGWAAGQLLTFGKALVKGALNNGVKIWWSSVIFGKSCFGFNYAVS